MTKREKVCIIIISIVLAILIGLMLSLANAQAAPGCPPTPTQPNAVTLVEFSTDGNTDFTTGVIVGLALTLVCVGMLMWLRRRGKAEAA